MNELIEIINKNFCKSEKVLNRKKECLKAKITKEDISEEEKAEIVEYINKIDIYLAKVKKEKEELLKIPLGSEKIDLINQIYAHPLKILCSKQSMFPDEDDENIDNISSPDADDENFDSTSLDDNLEYVEFVPMNFKKKSSGNTTDKSKLAANAAIRKKIKEEAQKKLQKLIKKYCPNGKLDSSLMSVPSTLEPKVGISHTQGNQ